MYTCPFTVPRFIITNDSKQASMSIKKGLLSKLQYVHMLEQYADIKRNEKTPYILIGKNVSENARRRRAYIAFAF